MNNLLHLHIWKVKYIIIYYLLLHLLRMVIFKILLAFYIVHFTTSNVKWDLQTDRTDELYTMDELQISFLNCLWCASLTCALDLVTLIIFLLPVFHYLLALSAIVPCFQYFLFCDLWSIYIIFYLCTVYWAANYTPLFIFCEPGSFIYRLVFYYIPILGSLCWVMGSMLWFKYRNISTVHGFKQFLIWMSCVFGSYK